MKLDLTPARTRFPDYRFRQKTRNNRVYITIIPSKDMHLDYTNLLCILKEAFPGIRITSGSGKGMTGVLPTLLELIEGPAKPSWAAMLKESVNAYGRRRGG